MASRRFSFVDLTPASSRRWAWACTVSASAAARKSLAACLNPSSSAFFAKAKVLATWPVIRLQKRLQALFSSLTFYPPSSCSRLISRSSERGMIYRTRNKP